MKKVKMTFSVVIPLLDIMDQEIIDNQSEEYVKDLAKTICKDLYESDGLWWDEEMTFENAEMVEHD